MKKSVVFSALAIVLVLFLSNNKLFAQFEQKFTLQLSGGYVQSLSPDFFTSVFENGFSFDAGAQYNFSRSLSFVVLAKYAKFLSDFESLSGVSEIKYNQIGLSLCPKYRFIPSSKVNPYMYGGFSLNYISFNLIGLPGYTQTSPASFGFTGGLGIDFRVSDNFALFVQGGYNAFSSKRDWISSVYTQIGANISMFKSKSL
ncbi:MAG: outer membrane beta-barrel protein [Tenuifilaceae bacterium]|jgi:opacity protein-like surface antigen|nr:outer membrane beta-barrel protein [Tenuifilaceae bacterium]